MIPVSEPDQTETVINGFSIAVETLARLPENHPKLNHWQIWAQDIFKDQPWLEQLNQCMTIAYTRMAVRNGSLSPNPRSYHNECHINDLLLRVMYCAEHDHDDISIEGLAILSYFAACHDLRQAEPPKPIDDNSLVGANEIASYQEAVRIIELSDDQKLWSKHHLLLLKTMIEGSTFGSGGKRSKNFFQGNLAKHLLAQHQFDNPQDKQLILLACDIDTANVSLPIDQFAESAIHIYDELITHQNADISAHQFFSEQQKIYFFEQQAFHANITQQLFQPHKKQNEACLLTLCQHIKKLPMDTTADQIKQQFIQKANELGSAG
jgi:hypothetical protein